MKEVIKKFSEISIKDIPQVGGKNASLGEMLRLQEETGIQVPDGFATTANAFWLFIDDNNIRERLKKTLDGLDTAAFTNLGEVGASCRNIIENTVLPDGLQSGILQAYHALQLHYGKDITVAVRSSATAEDLPNASFAGQHESYLNIKGDAALLQACKNCYASLFTDRAIKYRADNGFDHMKVALSIGVQLMVRADKASSGVIFTLDPDSGFRNVVVISAAWGLGENVVQGNVNTNEFIVYKPFIDKVKNPVISRTLGSKALTMIYADADGPKGDASTVNTETPEDKQETFTLNQDEVLTLARWAVSIENHYDRPMDLEWAKDGISGQLYIIQARPETVYGKEGPASLFTEYTLKKRGKVLCSGVGLGNRIASGRARILSSPAEIDKLQQGDILVTGRTDPDWDPVLKKASAIVTDQGGRTSHAAIVAREIGAIAIVGTGNGTANIKDGDIVTVSAAEGNTGYVYAGRLDWDEQVTDFSALPRPHTRPMLILGHPEQAFKYSFLPNAGVGLMRMEFIVNDSIGIHPMALVHFDKVADEKTRLEITRRTKQYADKKDFFVHTLAEATAQIAAAFYPKDVIVRLSDFKTNEYANLLGGSYFEPKEENPMIGFRGASRYYHPLYSDGFRLECEAMRMVREDMGFRNVKLMVPFCRTIQEASKVLDIMAENGLKRGRKGLEVYVMIEIPSNAILADEFAELFDGFSVGSNDLTQLTLGADRDSELLSDIFSPFDSAVMNLIRMAVIAGRKAGIKTGLCGQAPSDYPRYAKFLVECGIDSISFNPDALIKGIKNILQAEEEFKQETALR